MWGLGRPGQLSVIGPVSTGKDLACSECGDLRPARAAIRNRAGEYGENRAGECGEGLWLLSVGTWPEIKNTILTTGNDTD